MILRVQRELAVSTHPRPRLCRGKNRTMVVVAVQGASSYQFLDVPYDYNIYVSHGRALVL